MAISQAHLRCMQAFEDLSDLTPKQVVERLDRNIVGQTDAKKAVSRPFDCHREHAVTVALNIADEDKPLDRSRCLQVANALRNRWRRHKIPSPMKVA